MTDIDTCHGRQIGEWWNPHDTLAIPQQICLFYKVTEVQGGDNVFASLMVQLRTEPRLPTHGLMFFWLHNGLIVTITITTT